MGSVKSPKTRAAHVWTTGVLVAVAAGAVSVRSHQPTRQPAVWRTATAARDQDRGSPETNTTRTSKDELERWMKELSNWGRWGKDDQLGTLNLVTPEKRKQAARLVKSGVVVALAPDTMPATIGGVVPGPAFIGPPAGSSTHDINFAGQGRTGWVHEHNYALTSTHHGPHLDAICHVAYEGRTYNGYSLTEIATKAGGCSKMGIAGVKDKVVTRAILVDIARMKGLERLEPGTHIYKEDIEAFEKWAKVKFGPGDMFLYRLGGSKGSGLDPSFVPFLKERDIALFGGDTSHEAFTVPGFPVAVHTAIMVPLGMNMFDNLDLEALAATAARLKRWEFMFMAAPTPAAHGTGSQINPLAIF
jgi:kynurenine formamidase